MRFLARSIVAVVAVVVSSLLLPAMPSATAAPGSWDPRIEGLAEDVERLRGLEFKHPVTVRVLGTEAFDERVTSDEKLSRKERGAWDRSEASLRALGLLESGLEPEILRNRFGQNILGYYNARKEQIVVRGNTLADAATRAVLAHELTHALQDQHFDLQKISRRASKVESGVVDALVEGDATRIGDTYERSLSASEQAAIDAAHHGDPVDGDRLPPIFEVMIAGEYQLGAVMTTILQAAGQQRAIDDALTNPPLEDIVLIDPGALLNPPSWTNVRAPTVKVGEKQLGKSFPLGAWALYLVLGSQLPAAEALRAAERWGGDRYVVFTAGDRPCLRTNIMGRNGPSDTTSLTTALERWAAVSGADAEVTRTDDIVTLTTCEPDGGSPPVSEANLARAFLYVTLRNSIALGALQNGDSVAVAVCIANRVLEVGAVTDAIHQLDSLRDEPGDDFQATLRQAAQGNAPTIRAQCPR